VVSELQRAAAREVLDVYFPFEQQLAAGTGQFIVEGKLSK
jgi:hypothetical protein